MSEVKECHECVEIKFTVKIDKEEHNHIIEESKKYLDGIKQNGGKQWN